MQNQLFYKIYIINNKKHNKMNANKKRGSAQQTLQMIECGNLDLNFSIKYGTLLLGKTKRGKTTSAHYLMHQSLKGGYNDQNSVVYLLDNGQAKFSTAKIGQKQSQSETQIPNFFDYQENNEKKYLIDCPGYLDSFGCFRIISNRFFHMQVLSKVQNVRFIVTFGWNDMQWTADSMFEAFRQFLSGFSNLAQIQNELINATCILITSVPDEKDLNGVRQKYKLTSLNIGSQYQDFYLKLKKKLVEKDRVFMFKKAKLGQYCDVQNNLFNQINNSCNYWERKVNTNGEVDMRNIKISLADYLERDTINFNKELNQLKEFYSKHYESDIKNFISVITHLVDDNKFNSQAQQDSCKFIQQIKNISSQKQKWRKSQESNCLFLYQKYEQKRNKLKESLFKPANILTDSQNTSDIPFWLLKIKSLQIIEQLSEKIAKSQTQEREIQNLTEWATIIKNILEILITLAKSKKTKEDALKNKLVTDFAYEIFKVVEISNKIYRLVRTTTDTTSNNVIAKNLGGSMYFLLVQYPQKLKGMFLKAITKNSTQIFIQNMNKIDTENLTSKGSAEVSHFLSVFQDSLQKKKPQSMKLDQSVLKGLSNNIDTKIAKLNANTLASIKKQPNLSLQLIFKIEEEREKIQKKIHQSNQNATQNEKLKGEHNRVVHVMAECLYKNAKFQLALQVYETLFDADKIFQILDMKEEKLTQDKGISENLLLDHYIDYMNRARKYHRKQLAIKKAQRAYHVAQEIGNLEKISEISNFIRDVSTNKAIEDDVYFEALLKQIVEAKISKELCQKIRNTARLASPTKKQK